MNDLNGQDLDDDSGQQNSDCKIDQSQNSSNHVDVSLQRDRFSDKRNSVDQIKKNTVVKKSTLKVKRSDPNLTVHFADSIPNQQQFQHFNSGSF